MQLSKVGGKGLFVKEIELAMLHEEIDMAVHSMKDMPTTLPEGLIIGAIPIREDVRDCMLSHVARTIDHLPEGAKVGTSSLRRVSQLKAYRSLAKWCIQARLNFAELKVEKVMNLTHLRLADSSDG